MYSWNPHRAIPIDEKSEKPARSDFDLKLLWDVLALALTKDNVEGITRCLTDITDEEQHRLLNPATRSANPLDNRKLLHIAALNTKINFMTFFDLLSIHVRNSALLLRDENNSTVLHVAAVAQPGNAFYSLIGKINAITINMALALQDKDNKTVLHLAARKQPRDAFCRLIQIADTKSINHALPLENNSHETALYVAARWQSGDGFLALVNKADEKTISQTLSVHNNDYDTALHAAAISQPSHAFHRLVEKTDAKALNETLSLQNLQEETPLHLAAWKQSSDAFLFLIEKADAEALNQALPMQNKVEETILHVVATYQSTEVFIKLIERCSPSALDKACHLYEKDTSVLESALPYQPAHAIAKLLNVISDTALKAMLKAPNIPPPLLAGIASYLGHEACFQTQLLVGRLFSIIGLQLTDYCIKLWLAGKSLPPILIKAALPYFKTLIQKYPHRASELETIEKYFNQALLKEEKSESKEEAISIRLQSGEPLELKNEKRSPEILWQQGLQSLYDYHLLKKHYPGSLLAQTADDLYRAGLLFRGSCLPFEPTDINPKLAQVNALGEVLIKIIKPRDWPEFKKQIGDYDYRADLRNLKQDKSKAQDKYIHSKGKTLSEMGIEYEDHTERKKDQPYEHTIKQALSLLSQDYDTAVFGEHDPTRPLVGLLFSKKFNIIKAMLLKDLGTFYRKWVGSKEDVAVYAKAMEKINITDFEKFKEEVKKNPQRLNEVLAKLSHEAMLGVVFVTDTPEARKQARDYQDDMKKVRGIDLPIYFYDRALRIMRLYTPREQKDDVYQELLNLPGYNSIFEEDSERRAELKGEKLGKKLLLQDSSRDNTALHRATKLANSDFCRLIERADAKFLNEALPLKNVLGETVLNKAARDQKGNGFQFLIKKVNPKILNQTLPLRDFMSNTALHAAAQFQPGDAFSLLIQQCSPEALNEACYFYNESSQSSVLECAVYNKQPPDVIAQLLNRIDDDALRALFKVPNIPMELLNTVMDYLASKPSWQMQPLVDRLFSLEGRQLATQFQYRLRQDLHLNIMPSEQKKLITLLELYGMSEKYKLAESKISWCQSLWHHAPINTKKINQDAAVKVIALLKGEKPEITAQEFNALKSGVLGEMIADMIAKKILPEGFIKQGNVGDFKAKNS